MSFRTHIGYLPKGIGVLCPWDPPQLLAWSGLLRLEGDGGHWPALAQGEAGPRAACARCGDASTPPRRSHPSHAEEGSGSDGWYRGSPRECGFLGWGSPSSEATRTASPREREGHLSSLAEYRAAEDGLLAVKCHPDLGRQQNRLATLRTSHCQYLRIFTLVNYLINLPIQYINLQLLCKRCSSKL